MTIELDAILPKADPKPDAPSVEVPLKLTYKKPDGTLVPMTCPDDVMQAILELRKHLPAQLTPELIVAINSLITALCNFGFGMGWKEGRK